VRELTVLAMVFVKILLMDFSVIATLDLSEIFVKQVGYVLLMRTFNAVVTGCFSLCLQQEQYVVELCVD